MVRCPRHRRRVLWRSGLGLVLGLTSGACDPADPDGRVVRRPDPSATRAVYARFVDPAWRGEAAPGSPGTSGPTVFTDALPSAIVDDAVRFVLAAHPRTPLPVPGDRRVPVSRDGSLRLVERLPARLPDARPLAVVARARGEKQWLTLERPVVVPAGTGPGDELALHFQDDRLAGEGEVELLLELVGSLPNPLHHEVPAFRVPETASLHFAVGAEPGGLSDEPVRFSVSACERDACELLFEEERRFVGRRERRWSEHEVDLSELAGRSVSLRFTISVAGDPAAAPVFPVFGSPALRVDAPVDGARRVILLSLDTLRADHLGVYGYARETSPFFDRLAAESTLFEQLTAAATSTGPSHMSIMTSLSPLRHGATLGMAGLRAPVPTLAEWLRSRGFATVAVTENGSLAWGRGFGRGFDLYRENTSASFLHPEGHIEKTFAHAKAWLARNRSTRAFLFLHTYQVHAPYEPPPRYALLFGESAAAHPAPQLGRMRDAYDREIRYTDDQLRAFFAWLAEYDLLEDSLILITSDHGEEFGEHGGQGHRSLPHEELVRVPLLLRGPGVPRGLRVSGPASHVDLLPTILELVDVPVPAHADGRSLVGRMRGEASDPTSPVFSESWNLRRRFEPPALAVRRGDLKLHRFRLRNGRSVDQLFDLASDPAETKDVLGERREAARELSLLLDAYESRAEPAGEQFVPQPEMEEKLRALGYLE